MKESNKSDTASKVIVKKPKGGSPNLDACAKWPQIDAHKCGVPAMVWWSSGRAAYVKCCSTSEGLWQVGRSTSSLLLGRIKSAPSLDLRAYHRQGIAYEESNNGYHPDNIDHDITCGTRAVTG